MLVWLTEMALAMAISDPGIWRKRHHGDKSLFSAPGRRRFWFFSAGGGWGDFELDFLSASRWGGDAGEVGVVVRGGGGGVGRLDGGRELAVSGGVWRIAYRIRFVNSEEVRWRE